MTSPLSDPETFHDNLFFTILLLSSKFMFTIKMSLSLNIVKLSLIAANSVMINHSVCEQLIPFYNNLRIMSLEQAKQLLQNAS